MQGDGMGDYAYRLMNAFLGSEVVPASLRTQIMKRVGFQISGDACIWPGASFRSKKITIEPGVFINIGFFYDGYEELHIGKNVRIGQFVRIITATHVIGPSHQRGTRDVVAKAVRIQDGCWIGAGVTILPGVVVKRGCVIATGSVLVESTEEDGLYAGNPARRVRELDL
jgi:maltose O-acetyltransferase